MIKMSYFNLDNGKISTLQRSTLIIIRLIFLVIGVYILIFGGANGAGNIFGLFILISLALINAPAYFSKGLMAIPVDIELILLCIVLFELVGGDTLGLYVKLPNYDNYMHFILPLFIALIGMMLVYTMYFYGKLKVTYATMAIVIVIITIGLGSVVEMGEYTYDKYLVNSPLGQITGNTLMQGSPTQNAIDDTMNDLFTDTIGGIFGAAIGILLIHRNEKKGEHWRIIDELRSL